MQEQGPAQIMGIPPAQSAMPTLTRIASRPMVGTASFPLDFLPLHLHFSRYRMHLRRLLRAWNRT